jgi:hypothetical protein
LEDEVEIQVHKSLSCDKSTFVEGQKVLLQAELMYKVHKISRSIIAWSDDQMVAVQLHYPPRTQPELGDNYGIPLCAVVTKGGTAIGGLYWLSLHRARDIKPVSNRSSPPPHTEKHYRDIQ